MAHDNAGFLEALFRFDAEEDIQGLIARCQEHAKNPNMLLYAAQQLIICKRIRSAYILAMMLTNAGLMHPIISLALSIGGLLYNNSQDEKRGLVGLRPQTETMPVFQQQELTQQILFPILLPRLKQAVTAGEQTQARRMIAIFQATIPSLRTALAWETPAIDLSPTDLSRENTSNQGQPQTELTQPPLPTGERPTRRVVVVTREVVLPHLFLQSRPLHAEQRIIAAMKSYGWQVTVCPISGLDLHQDYHTISNVCLQQKAELLLLDDDLLMVKKPQAAPYQLNAGQIAVLRTQVPTLHLATVVCDAWSVNPGQLEAIAASLDLIWDTSSPSLALWQKPAFAHKVIHLPLPPAGMASMEQPPLTLPAMVPDSINDYGDLWFLSLQNQGLAVEKRILTSTKGDCADLKSYQQYKDRLATASCSLNFAIHPNENAPLTGYEFETIFNGSLLLQETSTELGHFFTPGKHHLTFSSLAELTANLDFIHRNPAAAEEIRQRGHAYARDHYSDEKLIGYLDYFLFHGQRPSSVQPHHNIEVLSYEYVSVHHWCQQVQADDLLTGSGNKITYFPELKVQQPAINFRSLHSQGEGYEDLFPFETNFIDFFDPSVPYLNVKTGSLASQSTPFVARLENVRIEFPGFGLFLDRHLVMKESYHNQYGTHSVGTEWYRNQSTMRTGQFTGDIDIASGSSPMALDTKFYLNHAVDQCVTDPVIMISGASWANYHHWMLEMLPRLWCITQIPALKELPVIVRAPFLQYQLDTLVAVGIPLDRIKPFSGRMLHLKNVIFPSYLSDINMAVQNMGWLRRNLLPAYQGQESPQGQKSPQGQESPQGLYYISRQNRTGRRRVLNEVQLVQALQSRGFQALELDGMPIQAQIQTFHSAKVVIMPHGAAGTNIIFSQPGTTLIELIPSTYRHAAHMIFSSLNNCQYGALICDDTGLQNGNDIIADINKIMKIIDKVLTNKSN